MMSGDQPLIEALATIRARGAIGERDLIVAIAGADRFVAALPAATAQLADLGSGGGLPALVIAVRRPDLAMTLIERRANRADQLRRAVLALSLGNVVVRTADAAAVAEESGASFDVVTARSFGPPPITAALAARLLRSGGLGLVSEPPGAPDRWDPEMLGRCGLTDLGAHDGLRHLRRAEMFHVER